MFCVCQQRWHQQQPATVSCRPTRVGCAWMEDFACRTICCHSAAFVPLPPRVISVKQHHVSSVSLLMIGLWIITILVHSRSNYIKVVDSPIRRWCQCLRWNFENTCTYATSFIAWTVSRWCCQNPAQGEYYQWLQMCKCIPCYVPTIECDGISPCQIISFLVCSLLSKQLLLVIRASRIAWEPTPFVLESKGLPGQELVHVPAKMALCEA